MGVKQQIIEDVVRVVLEDLSRGEKLQIADPVISNDTVDRPKDFKGIYETVDEAVENAVEAQKN